MNDPSRLHGEGFDNSYTGGSPAPWDIGRPQPAFLRLAEDGAISGRVLDVGCGSGEHVLMAARLGLDATGIDLAPTAIRMAEDKARDRGLQARFRVWDALDLPSLGERFDTVLDCGLFHVFDDAERTPFVNGLQAVLVPGGRYFLLCFSDRQPGDWGPRRIREQEIRDAFASAWRVDSIEEATLDITIDPAGARAWLAQITRT
ncbi:MAG: class I SAM-dependent methyltransferase [Candidatus Dormibacteraeota bacterium]|nr:class I SAM-dependent methyltransferase [Candidatus Dormibacteraeota bacterium]